MGTLGLLALLVGFTALPGSPQEERQGQPPGAEGPLDNDSFLPSSAAAQAHLIAGEELLARARAQSDASEAARLRGQAFERWHAAVVEVDEEASVFVVPADASGVRRLTEGLGYALLRRLAGLETSERRAWSQRFAEIAATELADAGGPRAEEARLLDLQRRHPGTPAAARAALLACDRALEAGRTTEASAHLARGRVHARLAEATTLARALDGRHALLGLQRGGQTREAGLDAPEVWRTANRLEAADSLLLAAGEIRRPMPAAGPGRGLRPGLCFLGENRLAIQGPSRIHLVRLDDQGGLERERSFEPEKLLAGFTPWVDERLVGRDGPAWWLQPAAAGSDLYLIHGRTLGDGEPNALACIRLPVTRPRGAGLQPELPRLSWALVGDALLDAEGQVRDVPELAGLPRLELQPGPVVLGQRVFCLARATEGDVRVWLLALDRMSGTLLWRRLLTKGADLRADSSRFGSGSGGYGGACQPLLALEADLGEARLFCGTQLGAGSLVDALDGSPAWSLRNRRRPAQARGWGGARPILTEDPPQAILWAPQDSDRCYTLAARPLSAGETSSQDLFQAPPRPLGEATALLGGDLETTLVLGRAGAERTVSQRRPGRDRLDGLYLGPDERFSGEGLASRSRVLCATTRGVYLFDRTRELYLLDYQQLSRVGEVSAGGDLFARGTHVLVLGRNALWSFRARP